MLWAEARPSAGASGIGLERALGNVCNVTPPEIMARLLSWQAGDVREIDDPTDYEEAMRAVKLYRKVGDGFQEGRVLSKGGYVTAIARYSGGGRRLAAETAALLSQNSVPRKRAKMLKRPGVRSVIRRRRSEAQKLHDEAIYIFRKLGENI